MTSTSSISDFTESVHQAAGHKGSLVHRDGSTFAKLTKQQEIDFYTKIQLADELHQEDVDDEYEPGSKLKDWMPIFLGTLIKGIADEVSKPTGILDVSNNLDNDSELRASLAQLSMSEKIPDLDNNYIVLQNLYYGFHKPSILDIKLGSKLYDSGASDDKRQRLIQVSRTTTSGSLNFRICGMKIYNDDIPESLSNPDIKISQFISKSDDGYLSFDKFFGRSLDSTNVSEGIRLFFTHNPLTAKRQRILIENTFVRLQMLYNCLLSEEVRIISGSLLFIFETDNARWEALDNYDPIVRDDFFSDDEDEEDEDEDEKESSRAPLSSLSFIDFAHAKLAKGKGYDENILQGVENLLTIFENLLKEYDD